MAVDSYNLSVTLRETMMRAYLIFTLLCPLGMAIAKETQIRCNVVPNCQIRWQGPLNQAEPQLQLDCQLAWAKVSTIKEEQWQRLAIDY